MSSDKRIAALEKLGGALEQAIQEDQATSKEKEMSAAPVHRLRRRLTALAAVGVIAAGFVILGNIAPSDTPGLPNPVAVDPAAAAELSVTPGKDFYEVRIGNVLASPESIEAASKQHGLDVRIQLIPSSPSMVGRLAVVGEGVPVGPSQVRYEAGDSVEVTDDALVVKIPSTYKGVVEIGVGRKAAPHERYETSAVSSMLPGEALHCSGIRGLRVRDALALLDQRGLKAEWRDRRDNVRGVDDVLDYYIWDSTPIADDQVLLMVWLTKPDDSQMSAGYLAQLKQGC